MSPTLTASYNAFDTSVDTGTLTTASFTPAAGDVIVVKAVSSDASLTFGTPSGGSLTFLSRVSLFTAAFTGVQIWTAVVGGSPSAMTVSLTASGTAHTHGMVVERWANGILAASPVTSTGQSASGSPSATLTTAADNSVVTWVNGDWNEILGSRTYVGSAIEITSQQSDLHYVGDWAYQTAGAAGSQSYGLTAPGGQKWTLAAIEIQAATTSKSDSDAGSGADAGSVTHEAFGDPDIVMGTDAGESIFQTGPYEPVADAGSGADAPVSIGVTSSDAGSGADSNGSVNTGTTVFISDGDSSRRPGTDVFIASGDSGIGVDSTGVITGATASSADAGSGADSNGQAAYHLSDADSGTGVGQVGVIGISTGETGTGTDAQHVGVSSSDTGTGLEASNTPGSNVPVSDSDTGTGTEGTPQIMTNVFDVITYGADRTGTTDSYTAFANAEAAAHAVNGVVKIPAGTYILSQMWVLDGDISVIGDGRETTTVKMKNGVNQDAVACTAAWVSAGGAGTVFSDAPILVRDVTFDANQANQTSGQGHGFVGMSYYADYQQVGAANARGDGIRISAFTRGGVKLANTCVENRIERCVTRTTTQCGIRIYDTTPGTSQLVTDGWIKDCIIADPGGGTGAGTSPGIQVDSSAGWEVSGNHLYGITTGLVSHGILVGRCGPTRVHGNYIENWGTSTTAGSYAAIAIGDSVIGARIGTNDPITVYGNVAMYTGSGATGTTIIGINFSVSGGTDANIAIAGNSIRAEAAAPASGAVQAVNGHHDSTASCHVEFGANEWGTGWASTILDPPGTGTVVVTGIFNGGTAVLSGTGSATAFTIAHGLGVTPSEMSVIPASAAAAAHPLWISADATNITVTFTTAPASGSNNVSLAWTART